MIVHALGEARHAAARLPVGHQEAEHAFRAGHQLRRIEALLQVPRQIAHLSMAAFGEESLETGPDRFYFFSSCGAKIQETVRAIIDFY